MRKTRAARSQGAMGTAKNPNAGTLSCNVPVQPILAFLVIFTASFSKACIFTIFCNLQLESTAVHWPVHAESHHTVVKLFFFKKGAALLQEDAASRPRDSNGQTRAPRRREHQGQAASNRADARGSRGSIHGRRPAAPGSPPPPPAALRRLLLPR